MPQVHQLGDRRTTVDDIFEHLYEEIVSLRMRPGDKISEAEIAAQFGVSRQPVRDAFSRLANLDLLLIRPQRATEIKRFSSNDIQKSRFVRAAIESEVLRLASKRCDKVQAALLDQNIEDQRSAVAKSDYKAFTALDYDFHRRLCIVAQVEFAFEVISEEKANVDRLCRLSLAKEERMPELLEDHIEITEAVKAGDTERAVAAGMLHLSRLDSTIEAIATNYADYFQPENT